MRTPSTTARRTERTRSTYHCDVCRGIRRRRKQPKLCETHQDLFDKLTNISASLVLIDALAELRGMDR